MNVCEECFYYTRTRYGNVCNYDGSFNPVKETCPHFKRRGEAEREAKENIAFTKLFTSMIDKLVQLLPRIERLEDEELKAELLEVCIIAKQMKSMLK